jgi:hypothetical protein
MHTTRSTVRVVRVSFALLLAAVAASRSAHAQPAPAQEEAPAPVAAPITEPEQPPQAASATAPPPPAANDSPPASPEPKTSADVDVGAYLNGGSADGAADAITAADEPSLRFYGFADFSLTGQSGKTNLAGVFGESPVFAVGNLNLYAAADLTKRWRSLIEVRFTYLPNGALQSNFSRLSTELSDNANIGGTVRWGGVLIERAWIEYSANELLTIRAGEWLTPVGIWNVDHGSPTIIPAFRPYISSAALFPEHQTGIELYGSRLFGETTLGYHLTISNGRGTADTYLDLDKNKALGWRAYANFVPLGSLTLGASGYAGRSTNGGAKLAGMGIAIDVQQQYDELAFAADLLWKWEGLHLQSEWFLQQVRFTPEGRYKPDVPGAQGLIPDYQRFGGYVLLGYRLPWLTLMPFVQFEYVDNGGSEVIVVGGSRKVIAYSAGINVRPVPSVTVKGQLYHLRFDSADQSSSSLDMGKITIAWSF